MEGLLPFIYKAIIRYKNGGHTPTIGSLVFHEYRSVSYIQLPAGESGRGESAAINFPSSPTATAAPESPRLHTALCNAWKTTKVVKADA